jgi:hypothetical protein
MRPSRLQDLLLRAALHPDHDEAARAAAEWTASVDLDTLDYSSLLVLPLLSERPQSLITDERLADQIGKVARMSWLKTETLSRQCEPALAALIEGGFEPVLIKGAALVHAHGVPARQRPMFDIDVLIARADAGAAAAVLSRAGYVGRDERALISGNPRLLGLKHGEDLRHENGAAIDLHWSALATIHKPELAQSLMASAVPTQFMSLELRALRAEDLFSVTIAHAADSWRAARDRWVGDCVQLLRGRGDDFDWDVVTQRAREWRHSRQTLDALDYLKDVAGVEAPAGARRELSRARVPLAVRKRRQRRDGPGGEPRPNGRLSRVFEDYEVGISDHIEFGAATGPSDFAGYLARRWGLASARQVPAELAFVAAGRPWRTRRALRGIFRRDARANDGAPSYELGEWVRFGGDEPADQYLSSGWWFPEDFGTWSRGRAARVSLSLESAIEGDAELSFGIRGLLDQDRSSASVDVVVNEFRLARIELDAEHPAQSHVVRVPAEVLAGRSAVEIVFVADSSAVPAEIGIAPDPREIGFALNELRLAEPQ